MTKLMVDIGFLADMNMTEVRAQMKQWDDAARAIQNQQVLEAGQRCAECPKPQEVMSTALDKGYIPKGKKLTRLELYSCRGCQYNN